MKWTSMIVGIAARGPTDAFAAEKPLTKNGGVHSVIPTSARLGINDDNVILVSSVINMNVLPPMITTNTTGTDPFGFAGSRVRVIKRALYPASATTAPLSSDDQFGPAPPPGTTLPITVASGVCTNSFKPGFVPCW